MGWKTDWIEYQLFFKVGPSVDERGVGCSLGGWGSPNTGRILMRNPVLVATKHPAGSAGRRGCRQVRSPGDGGQRYFARHRLKRHSFREVSRSAGGWTVIAVYVGFADDGDLRMVGDFASAREAK